VVLKPGLMGLTGISVGPSVQPLFSLPLVLLPRRFLSAEKLLLMLPYPVLFHH